MTFTLPFGVADRIVKLIDDYDYDYLQNTAANQDPNNRSEHREWRSWRSADE
jgi:hypothetical protein